MGEEFLYVFHTLAFVFQETESRMMYGKETGFESATCMQTPAPELPRYGPCEVLRILWGQIFSL